MWYPFVGWMLRPGSPMRANVTSFSYMAARRDGFGEEDEVVHEWEQGGAWLPSVAVAGESTFSSTCSFSR